MTECPRCRQKRLPVGLYCLACGYVPPSGYGPEVFKQYRTKQEVAEDAYLDEENKEWIQS